MSKNRIRPRANVCLSTRKLTECEAMEGDQFGDDAMLPGIPLPFRGCEYLCATLL